MLDQHIHEHGDHKCTYCQTACGRNQNLQIKIAGSDAHRVGDQGMAALRTRGLPKDSFEIAEILKSGDFVFEVGGGSVWIP